MASILSNVNIASGQIVRALHVTQSIDAFTGIKAYDISLSGSFNMTGSINGQPLRINPLTASYAITASYTASPSNPFPYYGNATIIGSLGVTGESLFEGPIAGLYNTAIGFQALAANINGQNNIAIGFRSLLYNGTGTGNIALGTRALIDNTSGNNNIVIGTDSQPQWNSSNNIIIGKANDAKYGDNIIIGTGNSSLGTGNIILGSRITGSSDNQLYIGSATAPIGTLIPGASWTAVINGVPVTFKIA
jgi:hypothetical protein